MFTRIAQMFHSAYGRANILHLLKPVIWWTNLFDISFSLFSHILAVKFYQDLIIDVNSYSNAFYIGTDPEIKTADQVSQLAKTMFEQ